jgi:hypothetical protein
MCHSRQGKADLEILQTEAKISSSAHIVKDSLIDSAWKINALLVSLGIITLVVFGGAIGKLR